MSSPLFFRRSFPVPGSFLFSFFVRHVATDDAASPSAYHSATTSQMTANAAHGCAFKAAFSLCGLRKNGKTADQCECKNYGFHDVLNV